MKKIVIVFSLILINLLACGGSSDVSIKLEVVRTFDPRLPTLSDEDMKEVLDEAKRVIKMKLGNDIEIQFHDNGTVPIDSFFKQVDYKRDGIYNDIIGWKYDLALGERLSLLKTDRFKKNVIHFLQSWELKDLEKFFPDKKLASYDEALSELMALYHRKIKWLKTLKTEKNETLLIAAPYQSYVHWLSLMYVQEKYDIVITNTLIVNDYLSEPYPHSIAKHAKVGGSSFASPKRNVLDGKSMLISTLEQFGNVKGISQNKIPPAVKNKIAGAYLLAHEFGHGFYAIPDVYDHVSSCLMNSSMEGNDPLVGYQLLMADESACPYCQEWVDAKKFYVMAKKAFANKEFAKAGQFYLISADKTPDQIDGNRKAYVFDILSKARAAFEQAKNVDGVKRVDDLLSNLNK